MPNEVHCYLIIRVYSSCFICLFTGPHYDKLGSYYSNFFDQLTLTNELWKLVSQEARQNLFFGYFP